MQRPHSHFQDLPGCTHFGKHACDAANPALPAFNELAARQLPGNCSNSLLLVNEANGIGTRGLGSRFSFYTACLAMAGSEGRIYIDKFCKGLDCDPSLVRPWTSCSEEDVAAAKRVGRAQVITNYVACFPFLHASPSPDMPLIVWWSAAFAFLMRPSIELSKTIDHELREFDGGRPAAGVHIRHCDKGLAEATLRPLADYMGLLQNHSHRPKTTQVRLITDDQAIYVRWIKKTRDFQAFASCGRMPILSKSTVRARGRAVSECARVMASYEVACTAAAAATSRTSSAPSSTCMCSRGLTSARLPGRPITA